MTHLKIEADGQGIPASAIKSCIFNSTAYRKLFIILYTTIGNQRISSSVILYRHKKAYISLNEFD